jgi:hypothetical protein
MVVLYVDKRIDEIKIITVKYRIYGSIVTFYKGLAIDLHNIASCVDD